MVIKRSFNAVNKVFVFVIFYYLLILSSDINRAYEPPLLMMIFLLVLNLLARCGVMAAISKLTAGEEVDLKSYIEGIKLSFLRYLGASVVLGIFIVLICSLILASFFIARRAIEINELTKTAPSLIVLNSGMLVVAILYIYIFPFVFVKGKGADAVIEGIKYLFVNLKKSITLIVMAIIEAAIFIAFLVFASKYSYSSFQYITMTSLGNFISFYVEMMIFAGACYILRNE